MIKRIISLHVFAALICLAACSYADAQCASCGTQTASVPCNACGGGCGGAVCGNCGSGGCQKVTGLLSSLFGTHHGDSQCLTAENVWDGYCESKPHCLPKPCYPLPNYYGRSGKCATGKCATGGCATGGCATGGCSTCGGSVGLYGRGAGGTHLARNFFRGGCASGRCGNAGCASGNCGSGVGYVNSGNYEGGGHYNGYFEPGAAPVAPRQPSQPCQACGVQHQPAVQYAEPGNAHSWDAAAPAHAAEPTPALPAAASQTVEVAPDSAGVRSSTAPSYAAETVPDFDVADPAGTAPNAPAQAATRNISAEYGGTSATSVAPPPVPPTPNAATAPQGQGSGSFEWLQRALKSSAE